MTLREFHISVTELAHFCCRRGDVQLGRERKPTAQQGIEGHKKLQAERPDHYQQEVSIKTCITTEQCRWVLAGRLDGLMQQGSGQEDITIVEEIKTTYCREPELSAQQYQVHLAQARLYAALLCQQQNLPQVLIRVTYLLLEDETTYQREEIQSRAQLLQFLEDCIDQYNLWLNTYCHYLEVRDAALHDLAFPFQQYREGQRALSVALYRDIRDQKSGLLHAPTGLGKTMAVLFPALKHIAAGSIRQAWYLTAKNSGHNSVKQALARLGSQLPLRTLFLQAREKICPGCAAANHQDTCPLQTDYYDRLPQARDAFQNRTRFSEQDLQDLAQQFQLCAHQLSRDLLPWVDLVVADYNYVFDPYTRLSDTLSNSKDICLLIDEAHNLPERARTMFSSRLSLYSLQQLQSQVTDTPLQKRLRSLGKKLRDIIRSGQGYLAAAPATLPAGLILQMQAVATDLNEWLALQNWLLFPTDAFEHAMSLWRFAQRAAGIEPEDSLLCHLKPDSIQLFCTDPAPRLQQITSRFHSSHYFSGSLLPLDYFQRCVSTGELLTKLCLVSPFPPQNLCTLIAPINTRFQQRAQSQHRITDLIQTLWHLRPGRYLLALPSYDYLQEIMQALQHARDIPLLHQPQTSTNAERNAFHQSLQDPAYIAGVIAGGLFAEGMDLADTKLDGVIIVGTCLPPPSPERESIKDHFTAQGLDGFDFAYRYPGINRVIQSAGRLIRSEQDRGLILLLDDRFSQPRYRQLLPAHWQPKLIKNPAELIPALDAFFQI